jgi:hypothetical protein
VIVTGDVPRFTVDKLLIAKRPEGFDTLDLNEAKVLLADSVISPATSQATWHPFSRRTGLLKALATLRDKFGRLGVRDATDFCF